jgi:hypothetical protein
MAMLVDERLFSRGQPTFYFEESVIEALVEKGIPRSKAVNYAANTCMEIGLPGEEMNSAWGVVMGLTVLMERTVDSAIESNGRICDRASFVAEYARLAEEHFNICADVYESDAYRTEYNASFTDDASVVEHSGVKVTLCEGERSNIKITTVEDFAIAEAFLAERDGEFQL